MDGRTRRNDPYAAKTALLHRHCPSRLFHSINTGLRHLFFGEDMRHLSINCLYRAARRFWTTRESLRLLAP